MGKTEIAGETKENRSKLLGRVLREETMTRWSEEDGWIFSQKKSGGADTYLGGGAKRAWA